MKTMVINGATFQRIDTTKSYTYLLNHQGTELYHVYDNWSRAKQIAFDYWRDWYCGCENVISFGICSHNAFGFSLSGEVVDPATGEVGIYHITPRNNRVTFNHYWR